MFISSLFLSIAASIDSIVIGFNAGSKKQKLPGKVMFWVSVIPAIGMLLAMSFGSSISEYIELDTASAVGGFLLIIIGVKSFIDSVKNKGQDIELSENLIFKDIIILGGALALNNITLGVSGSILGMSAILTSIFSFIFSCIFIYIGYFIVKCCNRKKLSKIIEKIAAILIVILGIWSIF